MTSPRPFRLGVAQGIIPKKWVRAWADRMPTTQIEIVPLPAVGGAEQLREGSIDAGILRLPRLAQRASDLHAIPLFEEQAVVVAPREHYLCAAESVTTADFSEEILQQPIDGVTWDVLPAHPPLEPPVDGKAAIEIVAAGVGVVVLPMSIARLHQRKDLTYLPVTDLPAVAVGLCWKLNDENPLIEEFIGIVRGRTAASTRGRDSTPAPKRTAQEKARARREFLAAQRGERNPTSSSGKGNRRGSGKRR